MEEREFRAPRLTAPLLSPPSAPAHGLLTLPDDPSEITEVNPWALATSASSLLSGHTDVGTTPLFVTLPKSSQINQQQLGNCWFLASISSILLLPDGPTRIYHMMREDPTHVVVRLYDNKRLPRYIKLSKTVIYSLSGSEYHAKLDPEAGTWPVFLEKALTAFDKQRNFAPKSAYYGRTSGGLGTDGLALLLGVDTMEYPIGSPVMEQVAATNKPLEQQFSFCMMMLFSGGFSPVVPAHLTVLKTIFDAPNVAQSWADWLAWLNHMKPRDLAAELLDAVAERQGKKRTVWKKGLVSLHEYSDSDVYNVGDFCFIRLINPWGNTGRTAILVPPNPVLNPFGKSAQVVETGQAEFDLELDDFTKRFRAVYHTVQRLRPADQ